MHVQVVTYRVEGVSDPDFIEANREFAEAMARVPGLLAKVWLRGPGGDGYGGLYLWRDREAYEAFLASDLWAEVLNDSSMLDVRATDYAVMEDLTRITQPGLQVL
jgi:heme-degrading monooxygenase HmoA